MRRRHGGFPNEAAIARLDGNDLAVVEPAEHHIADDDGPRSAAQRQLRHRLLVKPQLMPVCVGEQARKRPSTVRTTTMLAPTAGADSTSPPTATFQRMAPSAGIERDGLPVARAHCHQLDHRRPGRRPGALSRASARAACPWRLRMPRHRRRVPPRTHARRPLPGQDRGAAGPSRRPRPRPTTRWTLSDAENSVSSAGGSISLSLEQARRRARSAIMIRGKRMNYFSGWAPSVRSLILRSSSSVSTAPRASALSRAARYSLSARGPVALGQLDVAARFLVAGGRTHPAPSRRSAWRAPRPACSARAARARDAGGRSAPAADRAILSITLLSLAAALSSWPFCTYDARFRQLRLIEIGRCGIIALELADQGEGAACDRPCRRPRGSARTSRSPRGLALLCAPATSASRRAAGRAERHAADDPEPFSRSHALSCSHCSRSDR